MKLKEEVITYKNEDGFMLIGGGRESFNGIIKLNKTGEFLVTCLKEEITLEEILKKFEIEYSVSEDEIKEDVISAINQLKEVRAIDY
ncbi:MAG: PqqD family protein [Oscillospiraceae bacterium]|nr:PqqD family protein [Candidatus Ruminococcus equi]